MVVLLANALGRIAQENKMNQNPAYQRAMLLLEQHRYPDAERELRAALLQSPQEAHLHAMLSLVLLEQLKLNDAAAEAQQAITLDPDDPLPHYALAAVLLGRNRFADATGPINEAIRLDAFDPKHYALLARIKLAQRNWQAALDAANRGLEIDPNHDACVNLRGIALVQLGQRDEAARTIQGALERDPENAVTHANQGWALLHRNQPRPAMEHFREALRIDPTSDWARAGIVEAMKARNPFYRVMLAYFLFMARLSSGAQWAIIIGGYVAYRGMLSMKRSNPELAPYLLPFIIAYFVFAISTWLAPSLFNLLLRLDRFGRHALSNEQRIGANIVGLILLAAALVAVAGLFVNTDYLYLAGMIGIASLPGSLIMLAAAGWPRLTIIGLTAGLLTCAGLVAMGDMGLLSGDVAGPLLSAWIVLLLVSVFGGQAIAAAQPKK